MTKYSYKDHKIAIRYIYGTVLVQKLHCAFWHAALRCYVVHSHNWHFILYFDFYCSRIFQNDIVILGNELMYGSYICATYNISTLSTFYLIVRILVISPTLWITEKIMSTCWCYKCYIPSMPHVQRKQAKCLMS